MLEWATIIVIFLSNKKLRKFSSMLVTVGLVSFRGRKSEVMNLLKEVLISNAWRLLKRESRMRPWYSVKIAVFQK